ncbi:YhgE/Pip domain-containing protein [Psychromicrobium xiongbiense]|uniref:YhgE/Pip domain-containing protein n=1 Tax=Psychromicrobium xiongbiense TaxID=3051184 RepID=UPI00255227DB|nr:YhgE/Pip domain-containing protein [Psychromicrobium sp. YIM S02556]
MTVFRLALSELKRMTSGRLPRLAIFALALVPLLYGAVYLYANWDPYSNLGSLKAAVVVEDQGTTLSNGTQLKVGQQVAQNLVDGKKFDWVVVDSEQAAAEGVAKGTYSFALTIPKDFSANLASPATFDSAKQAILSVTTNDANNYLLSSIVDKVTSQVHDSVAQQVGETTANQLLSGYGTIHAQIVKAADGALKLSTAAQQLADGAGKLHAGSTDLKDGAVQLSSGMTQLKAGANQLSAGANQLSGGLNLLSTQSSSLPAATKQLADGAAQVAAGNGTLNTKVQSAVTSINQLSSTVDQTIRTQLDQLLANGTITQSQHDQVLSALQNSALKQSITDAQNKLNTDAAQVQQLATGSQAVSNGAATLAASAPALSGAINQATAGAATLSAGASTLALSEQQAADGAAKLASGASTLDDGAGTLDSGAHQLADGAKQLSDQLSAGAGQIPNPDDAAKTKASQVIGNPIAVDTVSQAKAPNYGSGLAPFFLVLALWIGAFMLVQAMRPLAQRALASNAPSWKIAVGGWLPFLAVSTAQAILLYLVVYFGLGLNPSHPFLTLGLLLLASMAFTALIQGIVALLGTPGKFVVLILLVLQLVSSGGTFPWQTTPEPLHTLHAILPMGHVVEGMRHLIYGADLAPVLPIAFGLIGYTLIGLALSLWAVHKHKFWTLKTLHPEISI